MDRRDFLQRVLQSSGTLALPFLSRMLHAAPKEGDSPAFSSRVVSYRSDLVRNAKNSIQGDMIQKLINNAVENLLEIHPAEKAWGTLFNPRDIVGIKINCLAGRGLSTSPEVVDAIIEGLRSAGVAKNHIIVWDRANRDLERAGFKVETDRRQIRYIGNDYCGYDRDLREWGSIGSMVSNFVTKECTGLINVPILKDHGIVGISIGLKNYFGAIHNPNKYHHNLGDPYVADVNMIPEIRRKTRLTICDCLTAQYEGGPPFMPHWSWPHNGILAGIDMVALDTIGWDIIEKKRKEKGMVTLKEVGREPTYIATAADKNHKLGTNDPQKIQLIEV